MRPHTGGGPRPKSGAAGANRGGTGQIRIHAWGWDTIQPLGSRRFRQPERARAELSVLRPVFLKT